jgi:hypothetical protein
MPTIFGLAGVPTPGTMDGRSFAYLLVQIHTHRWGGAARNPGNGTGSPTAAANSASSARPVDQPTALEGLQLGVMSRAGLESTDESTDQPWRTEQVRQDELCRVECHSVTAHVPWRLLVRCAMQ